MTVWVFISVIVALLAINFLLWKSGFLSQAEHPAPVVDRPVQEAKERKSFLKRLKRWKAEGKVSREEYEHLVRLCDDEWNLSESEETQSRTNVS